MACKITKDPDNNWYVYIDWAGWFDKQIAEIGGTFTITASAWFPDAVLSDNGDSIDDTNKKTFFYGSGGVDGTKYSILNRITYTSSALSPEVFTEDRTIEITIQEK